MEYVVTIRVALVVPTEDNVENAQRAAQYARAALAEDSRLRVLAVSVKKGRERVNG